MEGLELKLVCQPVDRNLLMKVVPFIDHEGNFLGYGFFDESMHPQCCFPSRIEAMARRDAYLAWFLDEDWL